MKSKRKITEIVILTMVVLSILGLVLSFFRRETEYLRYETGSVKYERAVVTEVVEQELILAGTDGEYMTGFQKIKVRFSEGEEKGEEIQIDNQVTLVHNIIAKEGMKIIVCTDRPEGVEPYYSVFNYDRSMAVWAIVAIFILLILAIGKIKGVRSSIGLGFTMAMVIFYMVPALYDGKSAVFTAILTVAVSSIVTCFCISGFEKKTFCNMLSTFLGGLTAGIFYLIAAQIMHINGGTMDEAESLQLISQNTGMSIWGILFAGVMIGALGAVMDVAVSVGAALWEIRMVKPEITARELFVSGMNIGKDMIGTMTNTLILAFAGGALPTLLIFMSYGVQYHQLLSSNFLAVELVQGIGGSIAVVLTVPISALICSVFYTNRKVN